MHGGVMFGWMWLVWVLLGLAVLVVVVILVRALPRGGASASPEENLKRRLARGDINEHEFQQRLKQLRR